MAQHVGDELQESAKKTAQAARKAVHSAKTVKKAAAKIATQNYAGAAVDLLKDENFRNIIIGILILSLLLAVGVFFIAPLTIYEAIVTAASTWAERWESIKESFDSHYYAGSSGRFIGFFKGLIGVVSDSTLVNKIRDLTAGDQDQADEHDLQVLGNRDALRATYQRKADAVREKIKARQDDLETAIKRSGQIQSTMAGRFNREWANRFEDDETKEAVYDGTSVTIMKRTVSAKTAVEIVAMYSSQIHSSIQNIKLSGLLKWLGYNARHDHTARYQLGKSKRIEVSMPAWTGTFIPQYLIDEGVARKQLDEYTDRYGCSLVDYLLKINCPNLYTIAPMIEETVRTETKIVYDTVGFSYVQYNVGTSDRPRWLPAYSSSGYLYSLGKYSSYFNTYYSPTYQRTIAIRSFGMPSGLETRRNYVSYIVPRVEEYEVTTYHISYTVPVQITTRSIEQVMDIVGLWEGWLPSEPEYKVLMQWAEQEDADAGLDDSGDEGTGTGASEEADVQIVEPAA